MRVLDLMTPTLCSIEPETTLQQAAALMRDLEVGALPVLQGHHLVGIVTDRDIVVRGLALALSPHAPVSLVMTATVHACSAAEEASDVLLDMETLQLRRMPVENDDDELVGMLCLSDLVAGCTDEEIGRALRHICRKPDAAARSRLELAA